MKVYVVVDFKSKFDFFDNCEFGYEFSNFYGYFGCLELYRLWGMSIVFSVVFIE